MDWHSTVAGFDFLGGPSIEDLQAPCDAIPEAAGVYILKRVAPMPVAFLAANPGGRFKGRDPTVSVSRLEERWIPSAHVVYIGKAGGNDQRVTLRSRIRSFMQFGLSKPCSHWGGRCSWQLADAIFYRGWLAALAGDFDSGIEQMTHAVNQPFNPGFRMQNILQIATQTLRAGRLDDAAAWVERASDETRIYGNHFGEPDALRLRGEILLARSRDNAPAAEQAFRDSIALAERQPCRPIQLSAAMSLARLLAEKSRRDEARDALASA